MSQRILVVSPDDASLNGTLNILNRAGFEAVGAATFEEASQALFHATPDLLIADERLGAFNGLHLVLRGRAVYPLMRAIVTTNNRDTVLESDARDLNTLCFIKPADPREWLGPVCRTLETPFLMSA